MLSGQPGFDSFSQSCSMTSECSIRFHIKKSSVAQFASSHLGNVDEVISCVCNVFAKADDGTPEHSNTTF